MLWPHDPAAGAYRTIRKIYYKQTIMDYKTHCGLLLAALSLCGPVAAQDATPRAVTNLEERIAEIDLPLLDIVTVDGEEPTCDIIYAPPGCMGVGITNANYVKGRLTIKEKGELKYDSGEWADKDTGMRIKVRGNTSALGTKKPYKIKLNTKADFLDRGDKDYRDKNWILLANTSSTHALKTVTGLTTGEIVREDWQPQWQYVQVMMNGKYLGCYFMCEAIKDGKKRMNVDDSGFIIENDAYWWNEEGPVFHSERLPEHMGYTFKFPDEEDLDDARLGYITDYVNTFENALYDGQPIDAYIDLKSYASWILGHDLLGSYDGGGANMYMYKDDYDPAQPTATPMKMGPLWDFDLIFRNPNAWCTAHADLKEFYYMELFKRPEFVAAYKARWQEVRGHVYTDLLKVITDLKEAHGTAIERCRQLEYDVWQNDERRPVTMDTNIREVEQWFIRRMAWMDEQMAALQPTGIAGLAGSEAPVASVAVYDAGGKLCHRAAGAEGARLLRHNLGGLKLPAGVYMVRETLTDGTVRSHKVVR